MNKILDGKLLADNLNKNLKSEVNNYVNKYGIKPKLATILVGENPASKVYVNIKNRTCSEVGIKSLLINLEETTSKEHLITEITKLNNDISIHAILLQLPLPNHLIDYTPEFLEKISPTKDVDGLHPYNRGKLFDYDETYAPCTPKGIIALLEYYNIELEGKDITIINRSNLVGKPLIFMFLKRNATVSICHTKTKNIDNYMKNADILVVAVGRPKFITKERIKKNAIIIDVGINRVDGKLCGDVDFDNVFEKCSRITPVPGGVGPLTVSYLLQNTFNSYKKQLEFKNSSRKK
jgi:methylenetetrahydrofolate dehydrogenase (NADP+)/methenyltetrahydrofolate cyclohydrolase